MFGGTNDEWIRSRWAKDENGAFCRDNYFREYDAGHFDICSKFVLDHYCPAPSERYCYSSSTVAVFLHSRISCHANAIALLLRRADRKYHSITNFFMRSGCGSSDVERLARHHEYVYVPDNDYGGLASRRDHLYELENLRRCFSRCLDGCDFHRSRRYHHQTSSILGWREHMESAVRADESRHVVVRNHE